MNFRVFTRGFGSTARAFAKVEITVDPLLSRELRIAAEPVKEAVKQKAMQWGQAGATQSQTARGVRVSRHGLEVRVEQAGPKSSNVPLRRPNYGGVQMRHFFMPALEEHQDEVVQGVELIIDGLIAESMALGLTKD